MRLIYFDAKNQNQEGFSRVALNINEITSISTEDENLTCIQIGKFQGEYVVRGSFEYITSLVEAVARGLLNT